MARKRKQGSVPTFDELMIPLVEALIQLGGSGSIEEINEKIFEINNFPDDLLQIPHGENGSGSEIAYRLAWARTYLKKFGIIDNSERAVWSLVKPEISLKQINPEEIVRHVRKQSSESKAMARGSRLRSGISVARFARFLKY